MTFACQGRRLTEGNGHVLYSHIPYLSIGLTVARQKNRKTYHGACKKLTRPTCHDALHRPSVVATAAASPLLGGSSQTTPTWLTQWTILSEAQGSVRQEG